MLKHAFADYISKLSEWFLWLFAIIATMLFPNDTFKKASIAILVAMLVDILSKLLYFKKANGGLIKSIENGSLSSKTFWSKTLVKFFGYLMIFFLVGIAYTNFVKFQSIVEYTASLIYFVMFFRECLSVLENLRDSGMPIDWLVFWAGNTSNKLEDKLNGDIAKNFKNRKPDTDASDEHNNS